jgi:hypothetical protein
VRDGSDQLRREVAERLTKRQVALRSVRCELIRREVGVGCRGAMAAAPVSGSGAACATLSMIYQLVELALAGNHMASEERETRNLIGSDKEGTAVYGADSQRIMRMQAR